MASALSQAKTLAAYNNKLEQSNVKLQYTYNKSLADADRSFQERMANSAHQREIKDLKAAGLNPVLSVTGGNGAATPSGSSTSVSKPNVDMSLPKAVMDMAAAQLNSATSLQTTAMNNAAAMDVARQQGINQLSAIGVQAVADAIIKGIPSGDSYYGQYSAFRNTLLAKFAGKYPNVFDRAVDESSYLNNIYKNSFRGVTLPSKADFLKDLKSHSSSRKSYTSVDDLINDFSSSNSASSRSIARKERRAARKQRRQNRREERRSYFAAVKQVFKYLKDRK